VSLSGKFLAACHRTKTEDSPADTYARSHVDQYLDR